MSRSPPVSRKVLSEKFGKHCVLRKTKSVEKLTRRKTKRVEKPTKSLLVTWLKLNILATREW